MAKTIQVKVSGTWRNVVGVSVKVAGTWRNVVQAYVKVAGVWKELLDFVFSVLNYTFQDSTTMPSGSPIVDVSYTPSGDKIVLLRGDILQQVPLGTNWDISTANNGAATSSSAFSTTLNKQAFIFADNGLSIITCENDGFFTTRRLAQYFLSVAYDVTTLNTTPTATLAISFSASIGNSLAITPTGSRMAVVAGNDLYEGSFGTAWDLSTWSQDGATVSRSSLGGANIAFQEAAWNSDGSQICCIFAGNRLTGTPVTTPYDLSTVTTPVETLNRDTGTDTNNWGGGLSIGDDNGSAALGSTSAISHYTQ